MKFKWLILCLFIAVSGFSSIIKKPPAKSVDLAYADLVCTEQDKAYIFEIISTMGENGKLSLLFKQNHLKEMGAQINHVHPLKFLSTIFSNSHLKTCMYDIWDDYFKRNGFMDGLVPSLTRENEKGKLMQYVPEFTTEVGILGDPLRPFFEARDWENLVLFLIKS